MEFTVLSNDHGWQWHLLDDEGMAICTSYRTFATASQAFEDLKVSKDALTYAPIFNVAGKMLEPPCYDIQYL